MANFSTDNLTGKRQNSVNFLTSLNVFPMEKYREIQKNVNTIKMSLRLITRLFFRAHEYHLKTLYVFRYFWEIKGQTFNYILKIYLIYLLTIFIFNNIY